MRGAIEVSDLHSIRVLTALLRRVTSTRDETISRSFLNPASAAPGAKWGAKILWLNGTEVDDFSNLRPVRSRIDLVGRGLKPTPSPIVVNKSVYAEWFGCSTENVTHSETGERSRGLLCVA